MGGISSFGLLLWQQCPEALIAQEYESTLANANVFSTYRLAVG